MLLNVASSSNPALIPAIISAFAAVIAAAIGVYAVTRAQSYAQLLRDIRAIIIEVLEKQLSTDSRGPVIARFVEEAVRRAITDLLGSGGQDRRRWYDK